MPEPICHDEWLLAPTIVMMQAYLREMSIARREGAGAPSRGIGALAVRPSDSRAGMVTLSGWWGTSVKPPTTVVSTVVIAPQHVSDGQRGARDSSGDEAGGSIKSRLHLLVDQATERGRVAQ